MLLSPQQFQQVSGALSGQGANAVLVNLKDYRPQHTLCSTNQRSDAYGGSLENRARLLLEVTDAVIEVWGASRVGMHLAPRCDAHTMGDSNPLATFTHVAQELGKRKIAFIVADTLPECGTSAAFAGFYRIDGNWRIVRPRCRVGKNRSKCSRRRLAETQRRRLISSALLHHPLMHITVTLHELMPKQWVAMLLNRLLDGNPISRIQRAIDQWE